MAYAPAVTRPIPINVTGSAPPPEPNILKRLRRLDTPEQSLVKAAMRVVDTIGAKDTKLLNFLKGHPEELDFDVAMNTLAGMSIMNAVMPGLVPGMGAFGIFFKTLTIGGARVPSPWPAARHFYDPEDFVQIAPLLMEEPAAADTASYGPGPRR